jgi:oligopeptide transport system substrate-binding protein
MRNVLLIFGLSVTISSCQQDSVPPSGRIAKGDATLGGTVRVAESAAVESFDPLHLHSAIGQRVGNQLHLGLMRLDPVTLLPVPALAERVESDSAGLNHVFHIRQGVQFHAHKCFGNRTREVTAHDVAFSLSRLCGPGSEAFLSTFKGKIAGADEYHAGTSSGIDGIRVIDDLTLQITLARPDESILFLLAQPTAGVISKKAYEQCDGAIVAAGPFIPQSEKGEGAGLLLVRNGDYFANDAFGNGLPYLDTLIFSLSSSNDVSLQRLLNEEVDLVTGVYLDPVRDILERHMAEFTGPDAKFMMQRSDDAATYEVYSIHSSRLIGFRENFLGHRDFSVVQMKR